MTDLVKGGQVRWTREDYERSVQAEQETEERYARLAGREPRHLSVHGPLCRCGGCLKGHRLPTRGWKVVDGAVQTECECGLTLRGRPDVEWDRHIREVRRDA